LYDASFPVFRHDGLDGARCGSKHGMRHGDYHIVTSGYSRWRPRHCATDHSTTAPDAMTEASTGTPTDVLTMVPAGTPLSIGSSASHVTASSLLFYSVIGLLVKSYLEA
jgi:hypothetical protein